MRIRHVVVTEAFAGTERYVADVARRQAESGHRVDVVGGDPTRMPDQVWPATWRPGATVGAATRSVAAGGRVDVAHSHLTAADAVVALTRAAHRGRHVSTRHIAAARGRSPAGRRVVPLIHASVSLEIAISRHVAASLERPPDAVLHSGVSSTAAPYDTTSRQVLVLQRLEAEKDTATALRAWGRTDLWRDGWTLSIAGDGRERSQLEQLARELGLHQVTFLGVVNGLAELTRTSVLLATTPSEGLGLSVLEAMAHGVPVVATGAGGHLECLPSSWPGLFRPGDPDDCGAALTRLVGGGLLAERGETLRRRQQEMFDVDRHVAALLELYTRPATRRGPRA